MAFTAAGTGPFDQNSVNGGLNIGHVFTIAGFDLQVTSIGVYDSYNDGLLAPHTVTIYSFSNGVYTAVPGGSVIVPAGTNAPLINSHRFVTLPTPVLLPPGEYAIIAFQMNGWPVSDQYSDDTGYNSFFGFPGFNFTASIMEFTTNAGPDFPSPGGDGANLVYYNLGSASFIYNIQPILPAVSPAIVYASPGQTVSLTASASGTPTISYQWFYGNPCQPIAGATNSKLVLSNLQSLHSLGNAGNYIVSASNAFGTPSFSTGTNIGFVTVIPALETPLLIQPLGDSITLGTVPGGYRAPLFQLLESNNFNISYTGTLPYNPTNWMPSVWHDGHTAERIDQLEQGWTSWITMIPTPNIILVLAGVNDYNQNWYLDQITNHLDSLISTLTKLAPQARIFVSSLTPRIDSAALEAEVQTNFNAYIPGIVASHAAMGQYVYFVDLHAALLPSDISPADGFHPNQSGYNKMAAAWYAAITNVIPPPGTTNATLSLTPTNTTLTYFGIPGLQYLTLRSTNLSPDGSSPGGWLPISTNLVSTNGRMQAIDTFNDTGGVPPSAAYYKIQPQ